MPFKQSFYDPMPPPSPPNSPSISPNTAPLSLEEIESLSSYKMGLRHLKKRDLRTTGMKNLSDIQEFLKAYYGFSHDVNSDNTETLKCIKAEAEKFHAKEEELADICDMIEEKFTEDRNPRINDIMKDMEAGLSNSWKSNLRNLKKVLRSHKTPILVAGETGSGKSSLINLLINKNLLPEAEHPCTGSICVIKKGERPCVQLRRSKTERQEIEVTDREVLQRFICDRSSLESNDAEGLFCRRVVFQTPLPQFHEGTYFVDSPGFRESPMLTQTLLKYMPKASAFVIVLMTDVLGGLHKPVKEFIVDIREKLKDISLQTMDNKISLDNVNSVTVKNVIFVFNRWDRVVENETPEKVKSIRETSLATLREVWPEVKEGENVFFLSVLQNFTKVSQNIAPDSNFVKLQTAVFSLIPRSHDARISTAYMWLEQLNRRIASIARNKINMAKLGRDEKSKQEQLLQRRLEETRQNGQSINEDMRIAIKQRYAKFIEDLLIHLRSEEALKRMCTFEEDEKVYGVASDEKIDYLPDRDSYMELWKALHQFFLQRIERETKYWNEEPALSFDRKTLHTEDTRFAFFSKNLRGVITEKVVEIDAEAQVLRSLLDKEDVGPETNTESDRPSDADERSMQFRNVEKALFGITAIIWVPLAVVGSVVTLPVLAGVLAKQKLENTAKLRMYNQDRKGVAEKLLKNFVGKQLTEELLKPLVESHVKVDALKYQAEKYFPSIISEFEERIQRLIQDERTQEEICDSFQPLLSDARHMLGHMYYFAAKHLHHFRFSESHLEGLPTGCMSSGNFPVRCASLEPQRCAVKVEGQAISGENAYHIFREEQAWRKLGKYQHLNIVHLYGLVCFGDPKRIGFVMERCDQTLAELVYSSPAVVPCNCPTKSTEKDAAYGRMASMSLQIATALSFIHQNNYIHRNLMMNTVSVFRHGSSVVLKLSDFGNSRIGEDVTTTLAGNIVYLPPEVLNKRGCSAASDVYAFGLLMWEMYHGQQVFSWLPSRDQISIEALREFHNSGKMMLLFKDEEMPAKLRSLIADCAVVEPALRPPMNTVYDRLKEIAGKDEVVL